MRAVALDAGGGVDEVQVQGLRELGRAVVAGMLLDLLQQEDVGLPQLGVRPDGAGQRGHVGAEVDVERDNPQGVAGGRGGRVVDGHLAGQGLRVDRRDVRAEGRGPKGGGAEGAERDQGDEPGQCP